MKKKPRTSTRFESSTREQALFCRRFTTLVSAKVPILETIAVCIKEAPNPGMAAALVNAMESIKSGSGMTVQLAKFPGHFSPTMLALFSAGELDGTIDHTTARLADFLEKAVALEKGA